MYIININLKFKRKEKLQSNQVITFLLGMFLIIFSESTVKFITINFASNLKFIILPVFLFIFFYFFFKIKLKKSF